jgi:hypothetical protein
MFPVEIPPGTTVETLFTKVLPETHARLVPETAGKDEMRVSARLGGGVTYAITVRGARLDVREAEHDRAHMWIALERSSVEMVLADWLGPKRFVPKFAPAGGVVLMTDPRVLKRLAMVNGRVELAIPDFDGKRVAMTVGAGEAARRDIDTEDPDAVIEAELSAVEELLAGRLRPEDALADKHVKLRGKPFVAMQFALALAPFYPTGR